MLAGPFAQMPMVVVEQPDGLPCATVLRILGGPRGRTAGEGVLSIRGPRNDMCTMPATVPALNTIIESLTEMRDALARDQAAASN